MEIHDEITVPGQEARYGETPSWLSPAAGRLIGDAVASVVQYAREVGKPIVIERLDFRRKKAALESESRKYSRMLSSFSYGKVKAYFISALSRSFSFTFSSGIRPGVAHAAAPRRVSRGKGPDSNSAVLGALRGLFAISVAAFWVWSGPETALPAAFGSWASGVASWPST